jgi:hypothetical protein
LELHFLGGTLQRDIHIGTICPKNLQACNLTDFSNITNITCITMKITKELAKFLAEEGALTKFIDNYNKMDGDPFTPGSILQCGFNWFRSPQGYSYWSSLCMKFKEWYGDN